MNDLHYTPFMLHIRIGVDDFDMVDGLWIECYEQSSDPSPSSSPWQLRSSHGWVPTQELPRAAAEWLQELVDVELPLRLLAEPSADGGGR